MRRAFVVLGAVLGMTACSDPVDPSHIFKPIIPIPEPPVAPATFVLEGTVRGDEGVYLAGASVKLVDERQRIRETSSNDSGYFRFTEVAGAVRLVVARDGYLPASFNVLVSGNRNVFLMLQRAVVANATEIQEGVLQEFSITAADAPCDPQGWDATALCKRLKFVAPRSGMLTVEVTWGGLPTELDILLLEGGGRWLAYSTGQFPTVKATGYVLATAEYEVRVHSYYSPQTFFLKATIPP